MLGAGFLACAQRRTVSRLSLSQAWQRSCGEELLCLACWLAPCRSSLYITYISWVFVLDSTSLSRSLFNVTSMPPHYISASNALPFFCFCCVLYMPHCLSPSFGSGSIVPVGMYLCYAQRAAAALDRQDRWTWQEKGRRRAGGGRGLATFAFYMGQV